MTDRGAPEEHLSQAFSGALRTFAFWVANGTVGLPLLDGLDYWQAMRESPSLMERVFAIYVNVIRLDPAGHPINEREAQRRAAEYIRQWMTGQAPDEEWEDWEIHLY